MESKPASAVPPAHRVVGVFIGGIPPIGQATVSLEGGMNVLFGRNGTGKSRILRAMGLDTDVPRMDESIEIHISAPPGPVQISIYDDWLSAAPDNPWRHIVPWTWARFPGVTTRGPAAHLLKEVYERTRWHLDSVKVPLHIQAAIFRLLERTSERPWTISELSRSEMLTTFIDVALEIVHQGRFMVVGREGRWSMQLAGAIQDSTGELSRRTDEQMARILDQRGLSDSSELVADLQEEHQLHDSEADTTRGRPTHAMSQRELEEAFRIEWDIAASKSCLFPLLPAGLPSAFARLGIRTDPAWRAAPVLEIMPNLSYRAPALTGSPVSLFADWRTGDSRALSDQTFGRLPPPLVRSGGLDDGVNGLYFSASRTPFTTFETNPDHLAFKDRLEALANAILSRLVENAPQLELFIRDPAGDNSNFRWGLLNWTASEVGGGHVHTEQLSDAQRRWSHFAIDLALWLIDGAPGRARMILIDEPERGMHRLGEQRLARGLSELSNALGVTLVVATHSPAFLRLSNSALHHVRRDSEGATRVESIDLLRDDPTALGISRSERSALLEALVLVPDSLDREIVRGLLLGSAPERWIEVECITDVVRYDDEVNIESRLHRLLRQTDTPVFVMADWDQIPSGTEFPGPLDTQIRALPRRPPRRYRIEDLRLEWEDYEEDQDTWTWLNRITGPGEVEKAGWEPPLSALVDALTQVDGAAFVEDAQHRISLIPCDRIDLLRTVPSGMGLTGDEQERLLVALDTAWMDHYCSPEPASVEAGILGNIDAGPAPRDLAQLASQSDHLPRAVSRILSILDGEPVDLDGDLDVYRPFEVREPSPPSSDSDVPF